MSEIMLAKDAKIGQWFNNEKGRRFFCCGDNLFVSDNLKVVALHGLHELTYLPKCTDWEWQPPKPEKKYRPFASMQEWWPHRNRWYRDADGIVTRVWCSASTADRDFCLGAKFLNDDGTDSEPFGVEVTE